MMSEDKRRRYILYIVLTVLAIGWLVYNANTRMRMQQDLLSAQQSGNKLRAILAYISAEYVDSVGSVEDLEALAIQQLLTKLDPHSAYIPAKDMSQVTEPLEGNFEGIGITFNMPSDTVIVINTIGGGPSQRLGVMPGDRILRIDQQNVAGKKVSQDSIVKMLRGKGGTKVHLELARIGTPQLIPITITRGKIPVKSVDVAYLLSPGVGYVKISRFAKTTHQEFVQAYTRLLKQGMKRIVLDLRDNPGGYLDQAFQLANEFLSKGTLIVYTQGRSHKREDYKADGTGKLMRMPVSVLINEGSASASEIVAGAIQDNDRGTIVGRRSFGKGLVQNPIDFKDGSGMRLTIARYYTPVGRCIQRPYDKGDDAYYLDLLNRYKNGEMSEADRVHFSDTTRYKTPKGKIVYGGGGIMPDIFVPIEQEGYNKLYEEIFKKNLLHTFLLKYTDDHRSELNKVKNIEDLDRFFNNVDFLTDFKKYVESKGVPCPPKQWKMSAPRFSSMLRGLIGRSTRLDDQAFYYYLNLDDLNIKKALHQ